MFIFHLNGTDFRLPRKKYILNTEILYICTYHHFKKIELLRHFFSFQDIKIYCRIPDYLNLSGSIYLRLNH